MQYANAVLDIADLTTGLPSKPLDTRELANTVFQSSHYMGGNWTGNLQLQSTGVKEKDDILEEDWLPNGANIDSPQIVPTFQRGSWFRVVAGVGMAPSGNLRWRVAGDESDIVSVDNKSHGTPNTKSGVTL